jgi:hypothetical protein
LISLTDHLQNEQECAAVAEATQWAPFYALSEGAPTVEQLLTHCSVLIYRSVERSFVADRRADPKRVRGVSEAPHRRMMTPAI